ncbi:MULTISPECIES: class I SAM-dependent methyltransferase [Nitrosomonas]|uniref:class I SAM-dependent methyltransferase n=1 Tax=Nitrosomonas TaxID=914 RepID=UPI00195EC9CC|nr:methyltransferase domain-containing protein [Nitrosomonas eutropha]
MLHSHRNRTVENSVGYIKDRIIPGKNLLDIGSGAGTITVDFARRLAPGQVTAVEITALALELTKAEVERQHLENVNFLVGDATTLGLPDNSFDIVHAHQVLQHVGNPVQALREMRRICKPDGIVAVRDSDYGGFIWYPMIPALDQWMKYYQEVTRSNGGEPDAGRYLLSWAQQAGFTEIKSTSSTWCLSTPGSRAWWGSMWADRILKSDIADQLRNDGIATEQDLECIAQAWLAWAAKEDSWMSIVHGEIVCCP